MKKNIKAAECSGLMLACAIAWQKHAGKACYEMRAGKQKHDETTDCMHQFEQLLACEAWMKEGTKNLETIASCALVTTCKKRSKEQKVLV